MILDAFVIMESLTSPAWTQTGLWNRIIDWYLLHFIWCVMTSIAFHEMCSGTPFSFIILLLQPTNDISFLIVTVYTCFIHKLFLLTDKPPIEELHQFLEFQLPRQWAPVFSELPLGPQRKQQSTSSLQFSFMGPKLFVNTTPVKHFLTLKFLWLFVGCIECLSM